MFPLVVGRQILPIVTHMNHVHIAPALTIVQVIVHIGDNFPIFSHKQLNTSFSNPGFESNSNLYNLDWSNHSNFS